MKGNLANLYPTPIYWVEKLDNFDEIQNEITEAIKEVEFGMKGDWGATHFLSDPSFKDNFIIKNIQLNPGHRLYCFIKGPRTSR